MGKVIGAVAVAAITIATGGTFLIAGTLYSGLAAGLIAGLGSFALSTLAELTAPKPENARIDPASLTRQVRQTVAKRRYIYGEARVSGPYAFIGSNSSNRNLHMAIMLAAHEVEEIGEVWLNDDAITPDMIDANGNVTSGRYKGVAKIVKHLGNPAQVADPSLVAGFAEWTSDYTLSEIAYVYVMLTYNRDIYASGMPNVSAWVRGMKLNDPRTGAKTWSNNLPLMANDYLINPEFKPKVDPSKIDSAFLISSANTAEEMVTTTAIDEIVTAVNISGDLLSLGNETILQFQRGDRVTYISTGTYPTGISAATNYFVIPYQRLGTPRIKLAATYQDSINGIAIDISGVGSGTQTVRKNAEPRYTGGGVFDSSETPVTTLNNIRKSMAGDVIYCGGKWRVTVGKYDTPTISFNENDFAGGVVVRTKNSRSDRFNRVTGTYISPLDNGQPNNYPAVKNDTYKDQDGGEYIDKPFDQIFTQRPHHAQRIAKIMIEDNRQEITVQGEFKLTAFKAQMSDNILLSFDRYGFVNKPFEVVNWGLRNKIDNGVPVPYIEMTLKETASTIYDWNNGEETTVDPAPNTELPNVKNVQAVDGIAFDSVPVSGTGGDTIYQLVLRWNVSADAFVNTDGKYEIQYKKSVNSDGTPTTDLDWVPSFFVEGFITMSEIATASAGTLYDIRIRAINNIGVRSAWNNLTGVSTGSGGGVGTTDDWGNWTGVFITSEDWGDWSTAPTTFDDYGTF